MRAALFPGIKEEYLRRILPDLEVVSLDQNPYVLFVRSDELAGDDLPRSLYAICRAGTGTANIPAEWCSKNGVVIFNAPGANANSVKEWVLGVMIAASRNLFEARQFVHERRGACHEKLKEQRGQFAGREIQGKSVYLVGAGNVGFLVSKTLQFLGMRVYIYDPGAPAENFYGATRVSRLEDVPPCEFISIHCPGGEKTTGLIGKSFLERVPPGVVLINSARPEVVDLGAVKAALGSGRVRAYVSDFHDPDIGTKFPGDDIKRENCGKFFSFMHTGALTEEAEERAQEMVARQFLNFCRTGAIENSVNFPECRPEPQGDNSRFIVINKNVPGMEHKIKGVLAEAGYNICYSLDKSPKESCLGYNIIDVSGIDQRLVEVAEKITGIEGVEKLRILP